MLEVNNLNAFYGKSHILFDVNLSVKDEEIVSLLGRNGTGRSTLLKTIMGEVNPLGSILFKGKEISGMKTFQISKRGLGYVPESRDIFGNLSVYQNLMMGQKRKNHSGRWSLEDMYEIFPILYERSNVLAGSLSGGEQQMLTLCRTLMGDPDLIMIDEPTEGLAPQVVQLIAEMFLEIKKRKVSILLVEQKLTIALDISDRVLVMGHGNIVFEGTVNDFKSNEGIRKEWIEI